MNSEERGSSKISLGNVTLIIVLVITVYAAIQSQIASNNSKTAIESNRVAIETLKQTQVAHNRIVFCLEQYTTKTLAALNGRTTYTKEQANRNVSLQESQARFLKLLLHQPPFSEARQSQAAQDYVTDLQQFVGVNEKAQEKIQQNPFPQSDALKTCLDSADEGKP